MSDFVLTPTGWICPKCGRVFSPATPMCFYCMGTNSVVTTAGGEGTIVTGPHGMDFSNDKEHP